VLGFFISATMTEAKAKKTRKPAAPAEAKAPGRPSTFTQEIADEIIARLAKGEPLAQICRDEHMPASRTVSDWKAAHESFSADFVRAREEGFDQIAADCLDIADETTFDTIIGENGDRANTEWISRSKLRIETRLKLLAKWDPKRYGDKVDVNHGGQDGNPVNMNWQINFVKPGDER
jgi:hypothetical protein